MPDTDQSLGIQDLRAIIHGLRMSGFSFMGDNDIREKVSFMIQDLPSPETLDSMIESPDDLRHIQENVGEIMKLIEMGGARDENFKVRYEAKTDIPPRYKVLKWRTAMKQNELTKNLIKVSMYADDKSEPQIAEQAIRLAQKVKDGSVTEADVKSFETSFESSNLHQEAALSDWWAGMKGGAGAFGQEVKNVGHGWVDPSKVGAGLARSKSIMESIIKNVTALQQSLNQSQEWVQDPAYKQDLTNILNIVQPFTTNSQGILNKLNEIEVNYKRTKVPVGPDGQQSSVPVGQDSAQEVGDVAEASPERIQELQNQVGAPTQPGGNIWEQMGQALPGSPDADITNLQTQAPDVAPGSRPEPATREQPNQITAPTPATGKFIPGERVKTPKGDGTVVQHNDNGTVVVKYDTGAQGAPSESKVERLAASDVRRIASSKKWVRVA